MSYSRDMMEELHVLKREASRVLKAGAEEWQAVSREKAHTLATDVKALLTDFRDTLVADEADIEHELTGRAGTVAVTALVAGIVIGYLLGKRP